MSSAPQERNGATRRKGLVFIESGLMIQRFIYAGAFAVLQDKYDLTYVFWDKQKQTTAGFNIEAMALPAVAYLPYRPERFAAWEKLFNVSCVAHRERSRSFLIRAQLMHGLYRESVGLSSLDWRHPVTFRRLAGRVKRNLLRKRRSWPYECLAHPAVHRHYRRYLVKRLGLHPEMAGLVEEHRPDFIILPSAMLDSMTDDVLQVAAHCRVPTFLLVCGWDNLSSKGLLTFQPTTIGAWGEQTRRHAIEIQQARPENVFCLGAPHYEVFRAPPIRDRLQVRQAIGLPNDRRVVLFGGSFRGFEETSLLLQLDAMIEAGFLSPMHVLYRPHPWRGPRSNEDNFLDHQWKHVTIDPEVTRAYAQTKTNEAYVGPDEFSFSIRYLSELLRSVDVVVSPMSTLMLEAMAVGKPVLALAYDDGKAQWSAEKTSQMTHFRELVDVPGVIFCRRASDFMPLLRQSLASADNEDVGETLRQRVGFFVLQDGTSYGERLVRLVEDRLGERSLHVAGL